MDSRNEYIKNSCSIKIEKARYSIKLVEIESINYSKTIPGKAGIRFSMNASMSQNTQSKEVNLTLPTFTLNTARFYPLAKKGGSKNYLSRVIKTPFVRNTKKYLF